MEDKIKKKSYDMVMSDNKLVHDTIKREELFVEHKGELKLKSMNDVADVLKTKTVLRYFRSYPKVDKVYIYNPEEGIYREFTTNELMVLISKIFEQASSGRPSMHALETLTKYVKFNLNAKVGDPTYDREHLVFRNGTLNISTGVFGPLDPTLFVTIFLPYNFDLSAKAPKFMEFLRDFTSNNRDREEFLRAWFWGVLVSWVQGQVFLYILGPGGSGKSTLVLILTALVGLENTITTSLRELENSSFEAANLKGKKLIVISDNENYKGDLSVLKQMVGQDSLKGRHKYKMHSYDLYVEGMVVIVGNYPLGSRDTMNAIGRRMRQFPADKVCGRENIRELLVPDPAAEGWKGELADELPGIFAWAYLIEPESAKALLRHTDALVPSMAASLKESKETLNPMVAWAREELESGKGSYVGFKMRTDVKGQLELARRRSLYPTYRVWAEKRDINPLGHKRFTNELAFALGEIGILARKLKRNEGTYIEGVVVKDEVYNRDRLYGAPLIQDKGVDERVDKGDMDHSAYKSPKRNEPHGALIPNLYEGYMKKLGTTPLKIELNSISKKFEFDVPRLVSSCLEIPDASQSYKERITDVVLRSTRSINSFGAIPFTYKPMGTSPRILPVSYGLSLNSSKRRVREEIYSHLGRILGKRGQIILDLDLVSCYTSILIGLYPYDLEVLQSAIEGIGLWKYIQNEFEANGRGSVYNKRAVKICTYSSFFMGGSRAMIQGILESFRKDMSLTQTEFKGIPEYEKFHEIARDVTREMQNSSIVTDFRSISQRIKEEYMGEYLVGPTGHGYKVTELDFKTAYPNYLQSFEFALLANTTLKITEAYPEVEIIGHFHDGNVLVIPEDQQGPIIESFNTHLSELGTELGLRYRQKIEVKMVYK